MPKSRRMRRTHYSPIFALVWVLSLAVSAQEVHQKSREQLLEEISREKRLSLGDAVKAAFPNYSKSEQACTLSLLKILEAHKTNPLRAFMGSVLKEYNLQSFPFGILGPKKDGKAPLLIFNWQGNLSPSMTVQKELSRNTASLVVEIKDISLASIDSQRRDGDITGFTHVIGSKHPVDSAVFGKDYLKRDDPLRAGLGANDLPIYSPDESTFRTLAADPAQKEMYATYYPNGFCPEMIDLFLHEAFHVVENQEYRKLAPPFGPITGMTYFAKPTLKELKKDLSLAKLLALYKKEVYKYTADKASQSERDLALNKIQLALKEIKEKYPETRAMLHQLEYAEGAADFANAAVQLKVGNKSRKELIAKAQEDDANAFFYRSGNLGLLQIAELKKEIAPERTKESSVWEIYIAEKGLSNSDVTLSGALETISDEEAEALRSNVIEYIESTN